VSPVPHAQQVIASHAEALWKGKNAAAVRGKLVQNLHVADVQRLLLGESLPPPAVAWGEAC
jgi:citrate lyase beta subunit